MASGLIVDYLGFGTIGDRPVTPSLHTGALGLYWATDEDKLYSWDGAWAEVAPPGAAPAFNDLTDVTITAPASGQVIEYDGAGWVNVTPAAAASLALNDLTDVTETTPSEGHVLEYNGTAWVNVPLPAPAPPAVVTEATIARTATPGNAGEYTRFTHADAKTYTFTDVETYVAGAEYFGRNVGAGALTLTAVGTIVLNAPAAGTLVVPQGGSFSVKMVSATEGDVIGYTEAAA